MSSSVKDRECDHVFPSKEKNTVLVDEVLSKLSKNEQVSVKSQQRGEPDVSIREKVELLREVLDSAPLKFLNRFALYLELSDLKIFDDTRKSNDLVDKRLQEIELGKKTRSTIIKRRRYQALQNFVGNTDFFTEEQMQKRNPVLYHQLVAKYHTKQEREAFLRSSTAHSNSEYGGPLIDLFMAHVDRNSNGDSIRRIQQQKQLLDEELADQDSDGSEPEYSNVPSSTTQSNMFHEAVGEVEIEDEEKDLFKEEFFTTMYQQFLQGKEPDFDYDTVDNNSEYDVGEVANQDLEDLYFDNEEPSRVNAEVDSETDSDSFQLPKRLTGLECEMDKCAMSVMNGAITCDKISCSESDIEDELDRYMRTIEEQLDKPNL